MADEQVLSDGRPNGTQVVSGPAEKVSIYGGVPVIQRAYSSAVHATSALASSTDFGATQLAVVHEIMNTLIGLKIWATA